MNKNVLLWILAIVITIAAAVYQRMTGPTYPKKISTEISGKKIDFKLPRTHGGNDAQEVVLPTNSADIRAFLVWKRYKTKDEWTYVPMKFDFDKNGFVAYLPGQPPAGKLEYFIVVEEINGVKKTVPEHETVVIRFKGKVPMWVLIPHIIAMFLAMLFSTRTGLEIFNKDGGEKYKKYSYWTIGLLLVGGFIFGPIMQKYAFGEFWTGVPFGYDLTDNKTLIAMLAWIVAVYMYKKSAKPLKWAAAASLVTFAMYMIPHSVLGSELDYNKLDAQKHKTEKSETLDLSNKNFR